MESRVSRIQRLTAPVHPQWGSRMGASDAPWNSRHLGLRRRDLPAKCLIRRIREHFWESIELVEALPNPLT